MVNVVLVSIHPKRMAQHFAVTLDLKAHLVSESL